MPGTVDDFLQRFGSASNSETMDDQQASRYFDRFASTAPQDREYDSNSLASGASEYLGKLPDPQFHEAAQQAYASASPAQQQDLMGTLMRALQTRGANLGSLGALGGMLGSGRTSQMDPTQYAQLANYARQQYPEVMRQVVQENPWFIKAMGNPVVMGALGMVASRMIRSRTQPSQPAEKQGGGLLGRLF